MISIKQISITILSLITVLFTVSSVLASHTANVPELPQSQAYYKAESLQENVINKMINTFNPHLSDKQKTVITGTIIKESYFTNFDPLLIASIIAAESSFHPGAVSPCQARGLMQITSCVSEIMNISNPFDIQQNIYAGTRYLMDLYHQFERYELVLAAYNAGPTRVARLGRVPRISETLNYIQRVSEFYQNIRSQLLATVKTVISQPDFFPVMTSPNHISAIFTICSFNTNQSQPTVAKNEYCEVDRSFRLVFKA